MTSPGGAAETSADAPDAPDATGMVPAGEPAAGEPAAGEPAGGEPAAGQPAGGEPVRDQPAATPPAAPKSRYSMGSMSNMLRSLLVVGFFLLILVAIVPRMSQIDRPAVDAAGKAADVAAQTRWPVEMPSGLGSGWFATTATYGPGTDKVPTFTTVWKTPAGGDIALKQAAAPTDTWVSTSVTDNPAAGSVTVGGRTLERYAGGRTSQVSYLVRPSRSGGLTLVATTNGSEDELKAFVAALKPVTPSAS